LIKPNGYRLLQLRGVGPGPRSRVAVDRALHRRRGALIEALASLKSLKPRASGSDSDAGLPPPGTDGSGMRNWKDQRRSNKTHASATDPQAKLMRKGDGQPAKLSYGAHVLMDNRHGLCAELEVTDATDAEHRVADRLLGRARRRRWPVRTVGADKGYCVREFIARCRQRRIRPHVAAAAAGRPEETRR